MSSSRFLVEATGKHRKSSRNVMKSEGGALTECSGREKPSTERMGNTVAG